MERVMQVTDLKAKYKDEKVLCVANSDLKGIKKKVFGNTVKKLLKAIRKHGYFDYRYNAEKNFDEKQVIPYVVLRCGDKYFVTERIKGDSRLIGKLSVAVGGHINPCDVMDEANMDYPELIVNCCIARELWEETTLDFGKIQHKEFITTFIDYSEEVSKCHVCLLTVIDLIDEDVEVKETDKLAGHWYTKDEINDKFQSLENWSQIAFALLTGGEQ